LRHRGAQFREVAGLDIAAVREALVAKGDFLAVCLRFWEPNLPVFTDAFADLLADAGSGTVSSASA